MTLDLLAAIRPVGATSRSRRGAAVAAGLALLALLPLALYRPFLHDFFALDDFIWLHEARNPDVLTALRRALTFPAATPDAIPTPFWRPLVDLYFIVAWRVFGLSPLPYHAVNVLLHGAVAALAACLGQRLTRSWWAGLAAGLLFALLPAYDFAVGWISDVTELLGACWYLLALVTYAAFLRGAAAARRWYAVALAALLLGLLTKESTATLPVTLALLTLALDRPATRRDLLRRTAALAPFVAAVLLYAGFIYVEEYRGSADAGLYQIDVQAAGHIWDYLQRLALPLRDTDTALLNVRRALALLFLAAGSFALVTRRWAAGFAFLWTLVALLPYSFFVAGIEYRYTYVAAVPFTLFWVVAGHAAAARATRLTGRTAMAVLATAAVAATALPFAGEARGRQAWLSGQARVYQRLFTEAPAACGPLAAGSDIYLLDDPIWDYYGVSSGVALSFSYEGVRVHRGPGSAEAAAAAGEGACVLRHGDGAYQRVTGS